MAVPPDVKGLDPDKMTFPGNKDAMSAIGREYTFSEKPETFSVRESAGRSIIASSGKVGPEAYLHMLFAIPDHEMPSKYDWKAKTKELVKKYVPNAP